MNNRKLERDLLKILKSKSQDEVFFVILNMINGTYNFEIEYINDIKFSKVMKSLEKIIVIGSNFDGVDAIECLMNFIDNIDSINYQTIVKNSNRYLMHSFKNKLAKASKIALASTSFILIVLTIFNMLSKTKEEPVKQTGEIDNSYEDMINEKNKTFSERFSRNFDFSKGDLLKYQSIVRENTINFLLQKYGLSREEFDVLCAIVLSESAPNSYDDAYAVINTIYNRTHSKMWVKIINDVHEGCGQNLYYQATFPRQFVVYEEGRYKEKIGVTDVVGYQAILVFLVSETTMHDYLSFRSNKTIVKDSERFTETGNNYFDVLLDENRIEEQKNKTM